MIQKAVKLVLELCRRRNVDIPRLRSLLHRIQERVARKLRPGEIDEWNYIVSSLSTQLRPADVAGASPSLAATKLAPTRSDSLTIADPVVAVALDVARGFPAIESSTNDDLASLTREGDRGSLQSPSCREGSSKETAAPVRIPNPASAAVTPARSGVTKMPSVAALSVKRGVKAPDIF